MSKEHLFDDPNRLHDDASALYQQGKYAAARLVWAQAKAAATSVGDRAQAFRFGYWESAATQQMERPKEAQRMLFVLLSEVPDDAPEYELWLARKNAVLLQAILRPERARLERAIDELEKLSQRMSVPAADLYMVNGDFRRYRGQWSEAMVQFAEGWERCDGSGFLRYSYAFLAGYSCWLGNRVEEALSWTQRLADAARDSEFAQSKTYLKVLRFIAGVFHGDPDAVAAGREIGDGWSHQEMRAYLWLRRDSTAAIDDPYDASHPARKLAGTTRTEAVHDRYEELLAAVDYRLACLRFTAGLPAVDDFFYQVPDQLSGCLALQDPAKFERQLQSFRRAWRRLRKHAEQLDRWLECDFRTQVAAARWQRAAAIATACGTRLPVVA